MSATGTNGMPGVDERGGSGLEDVHRALDALRVGLAGFNANSRQYAADTQTSLTSLEHTVNSFGQQVQTALDTLGHQIQGALASMSVQVGAALHASGAQVREELLRQACAHDALVAELQPVHTRERVAELEQLIAVGLPNLSSDIQSGIQQTLLEVARSFRLAEREHANRMAELHRDFDTTARRLEAALRPRASGLDP